MFKIKTNHILKSINYVAFIKMAECILSQCLTNVNGSEQYRLQLGHNFQFMMIKSVIIICVATSHVYCVTLRFCFRSAYANVY